MCKVGYLLTFKVLGIFSILTILIIVLFPDELISNRASAYGNLSVSYQGQNLIDPLFKHVVISPGECVTRTVTLKNNGDISSRIYTSAIPNITELTQGLELDLLSHGLTIYSEGLDELYKTSSTSAGVSTITLLPFEQKDVDIRLCVKSTLENNFQGKRDNFDLIFREVLLNPIVVPVECQSISTNITRKITGSKYIKGTNEGELILAGNTNDRIQGGGGDDCIVGLDGNDSIDGGNGNDVILLGDGNDHGLGNKGNDYIYGEKGNDNIDGGGGDDVLNGGTNWDILDGSSGMNLCRNGEVTRKCQRL